MDITEFQKINEQRMSKWHNNGIRKWSLLEWAGAMCGESGESANIAKKILRLDLQLPNKEAGLDKTNYEELRIKLSTEVADTIIYGILILSEIGIDVSQVVADVFDKKSIEYGFSERAPR